jgi:predicted chitinase
VRQPTLVATPQLGFMVSTWFWTTHHLNHQLGSGSTRELLDVTRTINGGTTGWETRLTYYTRALAAMNASMPPSRSHGTA